MKTNRISMVVRLALMGLLAVCLNAGRAGAQEVVGTFDLPFEAHWGLATLAPGEYSFTINAGGEGLLVLRRGTNTVAMIPHRGMDQRKSRSSGLIVTRNSEGRSIRELRLSNFDMVFTYAPQRTRRDRASEEREVAELIPIATRGK